MKNLPNNTLFITGTDTSVGKTYFCARLLEYLTLKGISVGYQKWVATGVEEGLPEDLAFCLKTAGIEPVAGLVKQQVPYSFRFPASPHLAAEMENSTVETDIIIENYLSLAANYQYLIVEGVGGLMVPLRRDLLLADLLSRLGPKTLLVTGSGLGTLNHTLLTLEAMRKRDIPILGVVFSDPENLQDERLIQDNILTIEEIGLVRVFGRLQRHEDPEEARAAFKPVGRAIFEQLAKV